jgi:superfamily II DNA or RNA helicase
MSLKLKEEFEKFKCDNPENRYSRECNEFLLKKEVLERENYKKEGESAPVDDSALYPSLDDPNFIIKIAEKKEFNDTKYDGKVYTDIKERADELANAEFEMAPHQTFVRNFLSFQTPYNSLLLFHSVGTGKTLSSIGVCEEMRAYNQQMGIAKRIIVVASPNVQENFRTQLFDERKLELINGVWKLKSSPYGSGLLKEVVQSSMKNLPREKIVNQIKALINAAYLFLGYDGFANYIIKTKNLKSEFQGRLIVIDEVHNIRNTEDNESKKVATNLMKLVKNVDNLRFLLLSATPMYNSYKEIVWLINLMNANDRRGIIGIKDVFDKNGNFKEGGRDILVRKATGYISYVRGENPYIFPYRVYPNKFSLENTFSGEREYPKYQMNGKKIVKKDEITFMKDQVFLTEIGSEQYIAYQYMIDSLRKKNMSVTTAKGQVRNMPTFQNMESFGYTLLQIPVQCLIIAYPMDGLREYVASIPTVESYEQEAIPEEKEDDNGEEQDDEEELDEQADEAQADEKDDEQASQDKTGEQEEKEVMETSAGKETTDIKRPQIGGTGKKSFIDSHDLTGKKGLSRMMKFVDKKSPPELNSFEYKPTQYGRIFSRNEIGKYSNKIKYICDRIEKSEGIILVYSQYIPGGLIPVALAMEELGMTRLGGKTLFKEKPKLDEGETPVNKSYVIISGDPRISPNNEEEIKAATNSNNMNGEKVKVILISKAGSEGVDFKYIRQVHILDPWYNMNRMEQIIGRAVRNMSHKDLPFEKRNVEIYLHATLLQQNKEEAADLYIYRVAEYKAVQIGRVTRILKEVSVDCILNHDQTNFTEENMDVTVTQVLSSGQTLDDFPVGDQPNTAACDYMDTCEHKCIPDKEIKPTDVTENTYNESFILLNNDKIMQRIRDLMKERFFYEKKTFISQINAIKPYPLVQIYAALSQLVDDSSELLLDKYGRYGNLINIGEYYLFQPSEVPHIESSIFERSIPVDNKHEMVEIKMKDFAKESSAVAISPRPKMDAVAAVPVPVPLEDEEVDSKETVAINASSLLKLMQEHYEVSLSYMKENSVKKGETDWFKHCGSIMYKLMMEDGMKREELSTFFVEHMIDHLIFEEKLAVLNFLSSKKVLDEMTPVESMSKTYLEDNMLHEKGITGIILYDVGVRKMMILDSKESIWKLAEAEDERDLKSAIAAKYKITQDDLNELIGFVGYEQKNKYLVFKVKDVKAKRTTGARCDQATKAKSLVILNKVVGEERFTKDNTKTIVDTGICIIEEFIMRKYNKERKDGKIWFLTPEAARIYKI